MDMNAAESLAYTLMDEHGLFKNGWSFQWDNAKRRLGQCRFRLRQIGLSRDFVRLNEEKMVRDTILHEIAHALVGPGHQHNCTWRVQACAIGAMPYASKYTVMAQGRFQASCRCGEVYRMYRTPRRKYLCRKCRQPIIFTEVSQ